MLRPSTKLPVVQVGSGAGVELSNTDSEAAAGEPSKQFIKTDMKLGGSLPGKATSTISLAGSEDQNAVTSFTLLPLQVVNVKDRKANNNSGLVGLDFGHNERWADRRLTIKETSEESTIRVSTDSIRIPSPATVIVVVSDAFQCKANRGMDYTTGAVVANNPECNTIAVPGAVLAAAQDPVVSVKHSHVDEQKSHEIMLVPQNNMNGSEWLEANGLDELNNPGPGIASEVLAGGDWCVQTAEAAQTEAMHDVLLRSTLQACMANHTGHAP